MNVSKHGCEGRAGAEAKLVCHFQPFLKNL
jgi:hypothetical protein